MRLPFIKICCIASVDEAAMAVAAGGDLDGVKLKVFMDAVAGSGR